MHSNASCFSLKRMHLPRKYRYGCPNELPLSASPERNHPGVVEEHDGLYCQPDNVDVASRIDVLERFSNVAPDLEMIGAFIYEFNFISFRQKYNRI